MDRKACAFVIVIASFASFVYADIDTECPPNVAFEVNQPISLRFKPNTTGSPAKKLIINLTRANFTDKLIVAQQHHKDKKTKDGYSMKVTPVAIDNAFIDIELSTNASFERGGVYELEVDGRTECSVGLDVVGVATCSQQQFGDRSSVTCKVMYTGPIPPLLRWTSQTKIDRCPITYVHNYDSSFVQSTCEISSTNEPNDDATLRCEVYFDGNSTSNVGMRYGEHLSISDSVPMYNASASTCSIIYNNTQSDAQPTVTTPSYGSTSIGTEQLPPDQSTASNNKKPCDNDDTEFKGFVCSMLWIIVVGHGIVGLLLLIILILVLTQRPILCSWFKKEDKSSSESSSEPESSELMHLSTKPTPSTSTSDSTFIDISKKKKKVRSRRTQNTQ